MLSGTMFPADMLPKNFQNVGNSLPATWGFNLMQSNTLVFNDLLAGIITISFCVIISIWKLSKLKVD